MIDAASEAVLAEFSSEAGRLDPIADESGAVSAFPEKRTIRLAFGRKVRSATSTGDAVSFVADGTSDRPLALARALVGRFEPDEPGFLFLRCTAARDGSEALIATCKVRPTSADLVPVEPDPPATSEAAYGAMAQALVATNKDLRQGFTEAQDTISALARNVVGFAEELGRFRALQEQGGNLEAHRLWASTLETVAPSLLAAISQIAIAQAGAKEAAKPSPAIQLDRPRPDDGAARLDWDLAALQSVALDLVGQHIGGNRLSADQITQLRALLEQANGAAASFASAPPS